MNMKSKLVIAPTAAVIGGTLNGVGLSGAGAAVTGYAASTAASIPLVGSAAGTMVTGIAATATFFAPAVLGVAVIVGTVAIVEKLSGK